MPGSVRYFLPGDAVGRVPDIRHILADPAAQHPETVVKDRYSVVLARAPGGVLEVTEPFVELHTSLWNALRGRPGVS